MEINEQLIDKLADLAKLEFSDTERQAMQQDFQRMLDFVDKLQEVEVGETLPLMHVHEGVNVLRPDTPEPGLDREKILNQAPQRHESFFVVPKVVQKD
ncbi:MAG: Asp-tRNA(Asn)/Glu-tRNA(Gln) amidotransferase subunit GatC [Bacteroidota bacterium]